jgi:hypothetical protein
MVSMRTCTILLFGCALALALLALPAKADTVSFGYEPSAAYPALTWDNSVLQFKFTITADSPDVFLATLSTGGGVFDPAVQVYGAQPVAGGGFETLLTLWDSSGTLIATSATCGVGNGDACMGTDPDAYGSNPAGYQYTALQPLAAGTYTLALTEFGNYPIDLSLADGFDWDPSNYGDPGSGHGFINGGNGSYAVEILNVNDAGQIPEPSGFWLFASGLAVVALGFSRRKRSVVPIAATPERLP